MSVGDVVGKGLDPGLDQQFVQVMHTLVPNGGMAGDAHSQPTFTKERERRKRSWTR